MSKNLNKCLTPDEIRKITRVVMNSKTVSSNKTRQFCIFFIIEKFDVWDYNELLNKKNELDEKSVRLIFNCLQLLDDIEISHKDLMEIYQYVISSNKLCLQNGGDCGDCGGGCGGACSGDKKWF